MKRPFFARLAGGASRPPASNGAAVDNSFHVDADQLPRSILDRLRHPSAPTYLVAWDAQADAAIWRRTPRRRRTQGRHQ